MRLFQLRKANGPYWKFSNSVHPEKDTLVALGLILRPRGLSGELVVRPYREDTRSFRKGLSVILIGEKSELHSTIEYARRSGRDFGVKLAAIDDRQAAIGCRNFELCCRFDQLPKQEPDEYYIFDLVGLKVIGKRDEEIGFVSEIMDMPAADLLVVETETGPIMVPFARRFIDSVSLTDKTIKINSIDELRDED